MTFILSNIAHFVFIFIHLKHCLNNLKTYEYLSVEKNLRHNIFIKETRKWALWRHKASFFRKKKCRSNSALYVKR